MHKNNLVEDGESEEDSEGKKTDAREVSVPRDNREPVDAIAEIVENLPSDVKEKVARLSIERSLFAGPLPPPEVLKSYDEIVPGSAKAFIGQFISQGDHRRNLERIVVQGDAKRANWGLVAGSVLGGVGVIGSLILIGMGHGGEGLGSLVITLSPIVGSLVYATRKRTEERSAKEAKVPDPLKELSDSVLKRFSER
jgi:hypothetical protein